MPSSPAAHLALMRGTSWKGAGHIVELDTRQDPDDGRDSAPATLAESLGPRLGPAATFATTEHFNLQTARAITVSEANGRASIYLAALSGNLIALAFNAYRPEAVDRAAIVYPRRGQADAA